jgi:hypothetical protein
MKKIGPGVVDWSDTFAKMSQFLADGTASIAFRGEERTAITPEKVIA